MIEEIRLRVLCTDLLDALYLYARPHIYFEKDFPETIQYLCARLEYVLDVIHREGLEGADIYISWYDSISNLYEAYLKTQYKIPHPEPTSTDDLHTHVKKILDMVVTKLNTRKQYEYSVIKSAGDFDILNKMGNDGWDYVDGVYYCGTLHYIFKREKNVNAEQIPVDDFSHL